MSIIIVQDLVKKYGSFTAVNGLSFEVAEGAIFGLLGPNGAGKTTTLEIIETLRQKTSGKVIVDGKETMDVVIKTSTKEIQSLVSSFERYEYTVKEIFGEMPSIEGMMDRYESLMHYINM